MPPLSLPHLALLFVVALVAGTIDAMAGGGGLLALPTLLSIGLPPVTALGTNKFQGVFSPLSATLHFWRKGHIRLKDKDLALQAFMSFFGAIIGAIVIAHINAKSLKTLLPFLMIGIACWMGLRPTLGTIQRAARLSPKRFGLWVVPCLGFYDGFLGPGAGTFFALASVVFRGLTLNEATIRAKIYNFMSNLGAVIVFFASGHIFWQAGCVMALGTILGGQMGARLVLRHGTGLIRGMMIIISLAISARLLWHP